MLKAIKIWNESVQEKDVYLDFVGHFKRPEKGKATLRLSCDTVFQVFLNGVLVGFGSCSNFKTRKLYYTFDISHYLQDENELKITVWHIGTDTFTTINQDAFLMFEVVSGKTVVLRSDKTIACRVNTAYRQGYCKWITAQLGYSLRYDTTAKELPYVPAVEYGVDKAEPTGIKNLKLLGRSPAVVKPTEEGFMVDLKKETVGFLDLDIDTDEDVDAVVTFAEHLTDGRVSRFVGSRDFSIEVKLKKGHNEQLFSLRRIACRYLEINVKSVKVNYLGLNKVEYPQTVIKRKFEDKLTQKIYDVSRYTLQCCMHEHYEDCPWREQALYTMDSRNQMLCGYYAFKGHAYQKANLLLIANSVKDNGLLTICAPSGSKMAIPFFSLVYVIQVKEYLDHTGDRAILRKVGKTVKTIMKTFTERIDETGLIANFPCWNFYEWSDGSSGNEEGDGAIYDLILNAMYVYVAGFYDQIFGTKTDTSATKKAIKRTFCDDATGLYRLSTVTEKSSVLGNSFALLIGLGNRELAEKLKEGADLVPVTLSMSTFFYDALLQIDKGNLAWILDDIKVKYGKMLKQKATTFWETEEGWHAFANAGSLCHGWSAMPVYYLSL